MYISLFPNTGLPFCFIRLINKNNALFSRIEIYTD